MVEEQPIALSLEELAKQVALMLEKYRLLAVQQDARVSAVPDGRTIRYYTTLGLLDRPQMVGRQAKYGKRHVLQLLAVKALQAQALPLAEIQARLYGLSDEELETLLVSLSHQVDEGKPQGPVKPIVWCEVMLAPGVKVMIEEGRQGQVDLEALSRKIMAELEAIQVQSQAQAQPEKGRKSTELNE